MVLGRGNNFLGLNDKTHFATFNVIKRANDIYVTFFISGRQNRI